MKKSDVYLLLVIAIIGGILYFVFSQITESSALVDGTAEVYYNNDKILDIYLEDGSYKVYNEARIIDIDEENRLFHVEGSNPYGVYIEYKDNMVGVIDEESPKNICQKQGFSNSPLSPITCLPNNIVILIEAQLDDGEIPDVITE